MGRVESYHALPPLPEPSALGYNLSDRDTMHNLFYADNVYSTYFIAI